MRKPNAKQNRFQIVTIFFTFFFSIFHRHYVTYVPAGFSTDPWLSWADSEGGTGGPDPPEKSKKKIGFLSNTGQDLPKNHQATKPAFNVGPLSARQPLT